MKTLLLFNTLEQSTKLIKSEAFIHRHRLSPKHFSRHRKWSFPILIFFILNFLKQSLQVELNRFNSLASFKLTYTKSAFSKARKKISPNAFKELFLLTSSLWLKQDSFPRFNSFRIFAIDSSVIQLPKGSYKWLSEFGAIGNQHGRSSARARISILCDVLSGAIVHAELDTIYTGERLLASKHLDYFTPFSNDKDLIIFYRGYPSFELMTSFYSRPCKFLMRVPKGFNSTIDKSSKHDFLVTIQYKKQNYTFRAIKVLLPSGEIESLITNLSYDEFATVDFLTLYFLRWPIETKYNTIKKKLFLETFSGKTVVAITQDFYATMYLSNLTSFAKKESDLMISSSSNTDATKYTYKTNENILIASFKQVLVSILPTTSPRSIKRKINKLLAYSSQFKVPIRPDRSYERPKKKNNWVFHLDKPKTAL